MRDCAYRYRLARVPGHQRAEGGWVRPSYLGVVDILVDGTISSLALLGVQHVPEETEPLVQKTAVRGRHGEVRRRQVVWPFRVQVVLGIGVHGVVAETVAE